MRKESLSRLRKLHAAFIAHKKAAAELLFKFIYVMAYRRLRKAVTSGSLGEVKSLCNGYEVFELVDIQIFRLRSAEFLPIFIAASALMPNSVYNILFISSTIFSISALDISTGSGYAVFV